MAAQWVNKTSCVLALCAGTLQEDVVKHQAYAYELFR